MMKNFFSSNSICAVFILIVGFWSSAAYAQNPTTPEELKDRLVQAINDQNREELISLFNWDGVDEQMRALSERVIDSLMEGKVKSAEFLPLPEKFKEGFVRNGVKYSANIKLVGVIKVSYEESGNQVIGDSKIAYGEKDGKYYFPSTIAKKTGYTGPPDKTININIIGTSAPDPVLFEGLCLYNVSGQEKKKKIKGEGNISEAFWGQEVKSCTIKKLSDTGSMKLVISVGGETIFESEMSETAQIIYP